LWGAKAKVQIFHTPILKFYVPLQKISDEEKPFNRLFMLYADFSSN
jgi:hypothetical protein